jgi:hypothetical protein
VLNEKLFNDTNCVTRVTEIITAYIKISVLESVCKDYRKPQETCESSHFCLGFEPGISQSIEACPKSIRIYFFPDKPVMAGWQI